MCSRFFFLNYCFQQIQFLLWHMQEHFLFLKEDKEKNGLPEEKGEVT